MGLTADIGRFLADMSAARVPAAAVPIVETGFTDCVAVHDRGLARAGGAASSPALAGAPLPEHPFASGLPAHVGARSRAALWHRRHMCSITTTPRCAVIPAPCWCRRSWPRRRAERRRRRRAMIAAFVAGYEVWAELIARDQDPHHRKGWHPSAVFGAVAAAAAAAVLRRLDAATGEPCGRHRRLARRRRGRQFRLHDQVVPGRSRGAVRSALRRGSRSAA